ncbi:hypothetical protein GLYMA_03G015950v4 [Glycine max]|nr:hypothetical protein GLYMA_03G015950v4 [Glycine max]
MLRKIIVGGLLLVELLLEFRFRGTTLPQQLAKEMFDLIFDESVCN